VKEAKVYFAILLLFCFDNSMCLTKIVRLESSLTICNY